MPDDAVDRAKGKWFQSAPDREAGRCPSPPKAGSASAGFNPRPTVRPGDALLRSPNAMERAGFNPRPTVRPGDACVSVIFRYLQVVSIRARP